VVPIYLFYFFEVYTLKEMLKILMKQNFSIMSEYKTAMGRIKHSKETGLRPVNQRRVARAIRRTIGMGLMPSVHVHPEIVYKNAMRMNQQLSPSRGPSPL
jgi:small subunit ribosomal protein S18